MCLNSHWTLQACWSPMVNVGSPMGHVSLRWDMLFSDRSPMRHVGLQWACQSQIKDVQVSDGSPIRNVGL